MKLSEPFVREPHMIIHVNHPHFIREPFSRSLGGMVEETRELCDPSVLTRLNAADVVMLALMVGPLPIVLLQPIRDLLFVL